MAHSLVRIKGSLVNTPHLIEQTSFDSIMEYVNQRIEGNVDITPKAESYSSTGGVYVDETQMGVMHINGPLTYRSSGWEALCGGTSYEMLKEQMEYFVEQGASTVVWMVDSGGGEAHGMMDTANYLRQLANDNDIKIIAYVDGMSASAAYGLSCVADEIIMSADSLVGSIGVLIQLMNNSKALEKAGYERTFITAGKDKVPFAKDGSFAPSFIERLQEQVDTLYEGFTSHVASHRSLTVDAVKDTEANVFMAEEALELGLVDKVMTVEEFYNYAADVAQHEKGNTVSNPFKLSAGKTELAAQLEQAQTELTASQEALGVAEGSVAELTSQVEELAAKLTAAGESVASLTAELESFREAAKLAADAAATAIVDARKAALAEVVPSAEVDNYLANMESMDEGAFNFMVGQLAATKDARADSFKPVGQEGAEVEEAQLTTVEAIRAAGVARAKQLRG